MSITHDADALAGADLLKFFHIKLKFVLNASNLVVFVNTEETEVARPVLLKNW